MSKTICTKCKQIKNVRSDVLKKRIAAAGSKENYETSYLCRDCRKPDKLAPETVAQTTMDEFEEEPNSGS